MGKVAKLYIFKLIWEKIIVDRDSDPTDSSLKGGTAPNYKEISNG